MKIKTLILALFSFFLFVFTLPSCEDEDWNKFWSEALAALVEGDDISTLFGWMEEDENLNQIESDINLASDSDLPSNVNLKQYFPPIGNQGQYGTCVAWAVGYNLRSFLNARDGSYSPNSVSQQYSPKDLFWSISNSNKGSDCNGTNFEPAFDVMVERGIAPLDEVPYTNLGDCSDSPQSSWTSSAANHKIVSYRKINYEVNTVKNYLAEGRAVAIGARLGDNFMKWNDDTPISSDTYNNPGMQHAYHAMAVCGYDDSKQAFRVVNSWNTAWGDNGYIWVDYNFFVNNFCFAAFVAKNKPTDNPDEDNDNQVDPDDLVSGYDLIAWDLTDYQDPDNTDPTKRKIKYNVFNAGTQDIPANKDWNIIYIYYNAYDANDYGILLYDYYSDDFGSKGEDGSFSDIGATGDGISDNWWNHIDAPAGMSIAEALYGGSDARFNWGYYMPESITGYYYLVLIADGYEVITEEDEENNYYFFTDANGDPVYVQNGVISYSDDYGKKSKPLKKPELGEKSPKATAQKKGNMNTYSPQEIKQLILHQKKTGALQAKVDKYLKDRKKTIRKTADK